MTHQGGLLEKTLRRPALVRVAGVAAVLVGALGLFEGVTNLLVQFYGPYHPLYGFYDLAYFVAEPARSFMIPLALLGVWAVVCEGGSTFRVAALSGLAVALLTCIVPPAYILREWLHYGDQILWLGLLDGGIRTMFLLWFWGPPVAAILAGAAASSARRGLGRARFALLPAGVISLPLISLSLFQWYLGSSSRPGAQGLWSQVVLAAPSIFAALCWIFFGTALYGALPRSKRRLQEERERTEQANLHRTRRLYEEAFALKDLSVLDELLDPEVSDEVHHLKGRRNFERSILDLHASFPDLRLSIKEQRARDDTVETRLLLSGTDRGGVLWYPPTGRKASFEASFQDRFREGLLVEHSGRVDMESLRQQLGLPEA